MKNYVRKWLTISFINLLLVSFLGMILRYKLAFPLPIIDQKHMLHSHSHFAFSGWITQTLMVLLVHYIGTVKNEFAARKYNWVLIANLVTAYGMMISFIFQGYGAFSITFSTLSLFVSYIFAFKYWRDLNSTRLNLVSHWFIKASFVFAIISSLGAYSLAYMMANNIANQRFYLAAIYYFLHFQYNGWFFFAGLGLLFSKIEHITGTRKVLKSIFWLFAASCIPAYLLSALWLPFPDFIYWLLILSVLAQIIGWWYMLKLLKQTKEFLRTTIHKFGRILLVLSAIAFTIKLVLQSGSIHPELSTLSYSFRPIVIGYLHLVLLAVTSIFILGYMVAFRIITIGRRFKTGITIFVAGIILNELLLMIQGVAALTYTATPYINRFLLLAAIVMFAGILLMLLSRFNEESESHLQD